MLAMALLLTTFLFGAEDPMTNNDVLDLVGKGVSSKLIVAMIENAETEFDTSTTTILALRDKGVPDEVLEAMLNAEGPPDLSDDGKLMVYVSDSQSWQMTGGFAVGEISTRSRSSASAILSASAMVIIP